MAVIKKEYIEHIYAGWLAKIIGIRLGAPIEGWTYEQIKNIYGALNDYPVDYRDFAADDDSNGPLFFLRALEDSRKWENLESQDVAEALLNYAPFEHGFFWWGGYGVSTEHTAYLNLRNGIRAPQSGSIAQNGHATAEQIGGQIFIDTWGLVTPGNPDLAAKLAKKAASVTHDGNGIYGGMFVAACISYAFVEKDIHKIIEKGLSYIPNDCEYTRVVRSVMDFYESEKNDWEACFKYIYQNFGYDKYPGVCHIIPNTAVMILSLLYGKGDFSDTLNICNRCGWDTDCNVGNVATIMGVRNGLEGISDHWRKPVNDFLACSSVVGSLNIMDIPYGALYIAKLASVLSGEELPEPYRTIVNEKIDSCHFEYPGSTHAIRVRTESLQPNPRAALSYRLENTDETAATGTRSLKVTVAEMQPGENIYIYKKTYYGPKDFHDSRYDPAFSPVVYPGQTINGSVMIPDYGACGFVTLYARDMRTKVIYESAPQKLTTNCWENMSFKIPSLEGGLIDEIGFCLHIQGENQAEKTAVVFIDDLFAEGRPSYSVEMERETEEVWTSVHREISQFTKLKGLFYLEKGRLHLSCADFGEVYTGGHDWKDYRADFYITPLTGKMHMVNVRVQGAARSYAAALMPDDTVGLYKNHNGYQLLASCDYQWHHGEEYMMTAEVLDNEICISINGQPVLTYKDTEMPYLHGSVGFSVQEGSHCMCRKIVIS